MSVRLFSLLSPKFSQSVCASQEPDHNSGEVSSLVNEAAIVTEQSVPRGEGRRDERQEEGRRATG